MRHLLTFAAAAVVSAVTSSLFASVVENSPGYNAWPMIQAVDGRLICTYSRGSGHSIGEGRSPVPAHVGRRRRDVAQGEDEHRRHPHLDARARL